MRESTERDGRDFRALTQYLTVLEKAPGMYEVVSESGKSYTVDARDGACECPDFRYRGGKCKHIRRVEFATGREPLPEWINPDELPEDFGAHVDRDDDDPDPGASAAKVVADGGECEDCAEHPDGVPCPHCFIREGKEWSDA